MYNKTEDGLAEIFPKEEDEGKFETEPGLSSYASAPADAGPSLKPLIDAAAKYIPASYLQETPMWVKATAGMRLVPKDQVHAVFTALDSYLGSTSNCPFKFMSSEIIGGEEEAVFAWISMNQMLGQIFKGPKVTQGILDMGGASMQVAFNPGADIMSNEFSFYVKRRRMSVYAKSFIQFGLSSAVSRAQARAAMSHPGKAKVPFACFNKGYTEDAEVNGTKITFEGTGDSAGCAELALALLHLDMECLLEPCSLMGVHMTPMQTYKTFYGLANYFYIANGLNLVGWGEAKRLSLAEIKEAATTFCGKELEEAKAFSKAPWKYKKNHCFGGHYMYHILTSFGFAEDDKKIIFARKLHGKSADWSLGAALYETRYMPMTLSSRPAPCDCNGAEATKDAVGKWASGKGLGLAPSRGLSGPSALVGSATTALMFAAVGGLVRVLGRKRSFRSLGGTTDPEDLLRAQAE